MKTCKCGSYALNIAPKSGLCDVCYWREKYESLKQSHAELLENIKYLLTHVDLTDKDAAVIDILISKAKALQEERK